MTLSRWMLAGLLVLQAAPALAAERKTNRSSSSSSSSIKIDNNYTDGKTRLEIVIDKHPKIVRTYDFQVTVTSDSSVVDGRKVVKVVIKKMNGALVEEISR
jgi:hypothetical protein